MLGGPLGAVFGAAFGHNFDVGLNRMGAPGISGADIERIQTAFFTATFSVMGHIAKADGQVSSVEIHVAEDLMRQMRLDDRQKVLAKRLFSQGKKSDFPFDDILQQFRMECHRQRNLLQMFMEILVVTALADGSLDSNESRILSHAADKLGFTQAQYDDLLQRMQAQRHRRDQGQQGGMALEDAYTLLGITSAASDQEVKKAYRRQMNQHHPDKLVSKGLPQEMMDIATRKTQDIKAAYEQIRQSRKD